MAHRWVDWLHHPCRLRGPQCFKAGEKIRSGPQVGRLATPPVLSGGSATLQSGGQNQQRPTRGQIRYITPAAWGLPNALERGTKSAVAHKCPDWLHHPCRPGDPQRFRAGDKITSGPQVGRLATSPLPSGGSKHFRAGGKITRPTSGRLAT